MSTTSDDIAFVRDLAEAGQQAPLLSGRFFVFFGSLAFAAYLGHYAIVSGLSGLAPSWLAALWIGFAVIALAGRTLLSTSFSPDTPGAGSVGNRADATVWTAAGSAIGVFFLSALVGTSALGVPVLVFDALLPLAFALYASAMLVAGTLAGDRRISGAGWFALLPLAATTLLFGRPEAYLVAAAGIACVAIVPGILLMRSEPKLTV